MVRSYGCDSWSGVYFFNIYIYIYIFLQNIYVLGEHKFLSNTGFLFIIQQICLLPMPNGVLAQKSKNMTWHLNLIEINPTHFTGMKWIHSIPTGMGWPFHSDRNGMQSFHSCWNGGHHFRRNGMAIPFRPEWNAIFLII